MYATKRLHLGLLVPTLLAAASAAMAGEGVLEISQTCAVETGCFSGDPAGFPVTIDGSAGRSYRLTSDLIVATAGPDAIEMQTNDVTVDLNDFTISAPVVCTGAGSTLACAPSGFGRGIEALGRTGIRLHDGTIRGFAFQGIVASDHAEIRRVRVESNASNGINVGARSIVEGCIARQNNGVGIATLNDSIIRHNIASGNSFTGITAGNGSSVIGNAADSNGSRGIDVGFGAVARDNAARANESHGIEASSGSTVSDNASYDNEERGLNLGTNASYRGNTIYSNTGGTVAGGVNTGGNACNGSTTCP